VWYQFKSSSQFTGGRKGGGTVAKFLIVGAGQAGLQLGLGLLDDGHDVTVVSNRTPEDLRNGRLTSAPAMFGSALATERALGIDLWEQECPQIEGMAFAAYTPAGPSPLFDWAARLDQPAQSVDQRVKYAAWMELLERRGGHLEIAQVGIPDLERYCNAHDLVIVAAGGGETSSLFRRIPERSPFDKPQKVVAIVAVNGVPPRAGWEGVNFTIVAGVGENIILPTLTPSGPGHLIVFQFYPGGPFDCWQEADSVEKHLAVAKRLLHDFLPRMYERCRHAEPMDATGFLLGGLTPVVREPVGQLPSGRLVLGIGDALVVNDPLTAPGANSAAWAADAYLTAIRAHGDAAYDRPFMEQTFDDFWNSCMRFVTEWNNMLVGGMPDHVLRVLMAANEVPAIRERFVNGFSNRADYFDWLVTPDKAAAFLEQVESSTATVSS
jgi:2-polyprenyl-6-methoxyphenol hydroxylase-like FAD-dependent oxidoreductase